MLVATAGHIDHGKTSLIRALTGTETDRLPEERARGISIDLGFAYWQTRDGNTIGFVDVPGHERFVRNMLAGVSAVDFALLVVAADDGVMPQTIEHLQILDLLGIGRGVVAITKCDRSPRERIEEVRNEVHALLARSAMAGAGAPILEVSTLTGSGVQAVGEALRSAACAETPNPADGRNFRLAIDRAFSVTGAGTVVTGTVIDGAIATGERVAVSPQGIEVRVRGLQSGGRAVFTVRAGQRCALNLAGLELAQVRRGDWLLAPPMQAPSSRMEVRLSVLRDRGEPLKHFSPVHLHIGTADIPARVLTPAQIAIAPGADAVVQLVLDHASCAVNGDRFVLRDASARHTIGGGRIIDPFIIGDRRQQARRAPISAALQSFDPAFSLTALMAIPDHEVDALQFEQCFNLTQDAAQQVYQHADATVLDGPQRLILPASRIDAAKDEIRTSLQAFHDAQPEQTGMNSGELKARLSVALSTQAFLPIVRQLIESHLIESRGVYFKLTQHIPSFTPADTALWQKLLPKLEARDVQPFSARELAVDFNVSEGAIKALLYRQRGIGEVWCITGERFLLRQHVAALAATARCVMVQRGGKGFTAAQFRDAINTGRTLAIHILEFFDNIGVTLRSNNLRKMRRDYELVVGNALPYTPNAKAPGSRSSEEASDGCTPIN